MSTTPQSHDAMNATSAKPATDLLGSIQEFRTMIGEGLNDTELTCLLREMALPAEAGFKFLSFSEGVVTFSRA